MTTEMKGEYTPKQFEQFVKIMIKHKVEEFSQVGASIKLSPLAMIDKEAKRSKREAVSPSIDDDLFYSSDKTKAKVK